MLRIASLIPSGTDLPAALGFADCLVGVSHECDHPDAIDLPVLTHLRDTQNYVNAAFEGKSIFDLPPSVAAQDVVQWQPIAKWLAE